MLVKSFACNQVALMSCLSTYIFHIKRNLDEYQFQHQKILVKHVHDEIKKFKNINVKDKTIVSLACNC